MKFDPSLVHELVEASQGRPVVRFRAGTPVGFSEDLERIRSIPVRELDTKDPLAAQLWTKHLRLERTKPCDCVERWGFCITDLRPVQGWALEEASDANGLLASIGVGDGKTGIDILLPMAIPGVRTAALLLPPALKPQFLLRDLPQWGAHFRVPNLAGGRGGWYTDGRPVLHVITYNELSATKNSDLLSRIPNLDLIIADEAHSLRDPGAARTIRFLRAFSRLPNTRFAALSGTLTTRSLKDYAHLSALALRERSPLPIHPPTVDEWAAALDATSSAQPFLKDPGELLKFATGLETTIPPGKDHDTELARAGFARRFSSTHGVVVTADNTLRSSLLIEDRSVALPVEIDPEGAKQLSPEFRFHLETSNAASIIHAAINYVRESSTRPDGEEAIDKLEVARWVRQVASGFFYRWRFPRGETPEQIEKWRAARKAWRREIRTELSNPRENYDSPGNVTRAAIRWFEGYHFTDPVTNERKFFPPHTSRGPLPTLAANAWLAWKEVHKTVEPQTEAVWISDWLVHDAIEWASKAPGIVWVEHDECMARARQIAKAKRLDFGFYGGGKEASVQIIGERGKRSIFASIKAHGEGKNLQHAFFRNLVLHSPSNGKTWEQLLGRTHREGQPAAEVTCAIYRYHEELRADFDAASNHARYIEQTIRSPQRLNFASKSWVDE